MEKAWKVEKAWKHARTVGSPTDRAQIRPHSTLRGACGVDVRRDSMATSSGRVTPLDKPSPIGRGIPISASAIQPVDDAVVGPRRQVGYLSAFDLLQHPLSLGVSSMTTDLTVGRRPGWCTGCSPAAHDPWGDRSRTGCPAPTGPAAGMPPWRLSPDYAHLACREDGTRTPWRTPRRGGHPCHFQQAGALGGASRRGLRVKPRSRRIRWRWRTRPRGCHRNQKRPSPGPRYSRR